MKCTEHRCNLPTYRNHNKCVLHYPKDNEMQDYHMHFEELDDFRIQLVKSIVEQIFEHHDETNDLNRTNVQIYLLSLQTTETLDEAIDPFLKERKVVFTQVAFPIRDERDPCDYLPILKKLGSIHFNYSKFFLPSLDLENTACFFQDCEFFDTWNINDYIPTSDIEDVSIYQSCIFYEEVSCAGGTLEEKKKISYCQFNGCTFQANLIIENAYLEKPLFNNWEGFRGNIKNLKIHDSILESRFILNSHVIFSVNFANNIFKNKVEFERNAVNKCDIFNCNFEKIADFYLSKLEEFDLGKSIFEGYTGFENCEFGYKYPVNSNVVATFHYVTFMSFVNFRNTYFFGGLDLDSINVKEPPNFLNTEVDPIYTTKETFRLIKYSFDKIGNHTAANRFFALEMKKYKEDLYQYQDKQAEKFILWCNEIISNFGQNYIRPIVLIILLSIIFSVFKYMNDINFIYNLSPKLNNYILPLIKILNTLAMNIMPFNRFLIEGLEFISLIYYIINSILVWQTIVALKRYTKR